MYQINDIRVGDYVVTQGERPELVIAIDEANEDIFLTGGGVCGPADVIEILLESEAVGADTRPELVTWL